MTQIGWSEEDFPLPSSTSGFCSSPRSITKKEMYRIIDKADGGYRDTLMGSHYVCLSSSCTVHVHIANREPFLSV